MKLFITLLLLFSISYSILNTSNLLILPKNKLNTHFNIVGSVSRSDSINDQYARPLYSTKKNQYYFKEGNNYVILMEPNIGINYNYTGIENAIDDKVIYRLIKYGSFYNYVFFDISPIIKSNFFFKINSKKYFIEKKFHMIDDHVINIDVNYYDMSITYSLYFQNITNYKPKISNLKHGYFITLSNSYNNNGTKMDHYIVRWDCSKPIEIYIDKSIPKIYLKTFKESIEEWNIAFNKNSNCIIKAITYKNNAWNNFKYGDARYSTISLSPSSLKDTYAVGHIDFDWCNGKIFRGNIMISSKWINYWANVYNYLNNIKRINYNTTRENMCINDSLLKNDYTQIDFIKRGLKSVIVHEMGHILGLRHNFKASSLIEYDEIFNKCRILKDGLIPSIMDYLSYVININNIFDCIDWKCIVKNIEIMDTIGIYDKQTIEYGYGKSNIMEYYLGPDEFINYDPLSSTGDISNTPSKYYDDDLTISKYVISNYNKLPSISNKNFKASWKKNSKLLITHMNKLVSYIRKSIKILVQVSYNFDGNIIDTKNAQKEALHFLKNVMKKKYFIEDRKYFMYDDCDIRDNYMCQGMVSFDLVDTNKQILMDIQMTLNSYDFRVIIDKNYDMTNKTISFNNIITIFS